MSLRFWKVHNIVSVTKSGKKEMTTKYNLDICNFSLLSGGSKVENFNCNLYVIIEI